MPGQGGPAAAGEQREPVVEALGQLGRGQRAQPRDRQLDRQRHAVERPADLRHRPGVARVELEVGQHRGGAVGEQPHGRKRSPGRTADGPSPGGLGGGRGRERRDHVQALAADPQRLPAGRQHPDAGAVGQQPGREDGGGLDHVLAVVEDQQRVPFRQGRAEPVNRVGAPVGAAPGDRPLAQAERVEDRVRHLRRLGHRGELGEPGRPAVPARIGPGQALGRLGRQPGLAHAARPGQRDQALGRELLQHGGHLAVPADEAGRLTPAAPRRGAAAVSAGGASASGRLAASGLAPAAAAAGTSCRRTAR